jgi:hypothetical protein
MFHNQKTSPKKWKNATGNGMVQGLGPARHGHHPTPTNCPNLLRGLWSHPKKERIQYSIVNIYWECLMAWVYRIRSNKNRLPILEGFQFFAWRLEVVTWGKNGNMDNHTDITHNDWVMFFRQKCWLVVEPRSLAATHNPCACRNIGTSFNGCKLLGNILRFGELRPSLLGRCPSSKTMFFYKHHMLCYQNKLYTRWNLCKMRYNEFKTHVQVTVMIMMNGNWTCKKKNMTVYSLSPWCLGNAMALSFNSFLLLKEHCHSAKIKLCGTHVFCHTCFGLDYTDNRLLTTKKCPGKVLRLLPWWPYVHETNHQIWNASKCPHTNNSNKATMPQSSFDDRHAFRAGSIHREPAE